MVPRIEDAASIACRNHPDDGTYVTWIERFGKVVVQCRTCGAPLFDFNVRPGKCRCPPASLSLEAIVELLRDEAGKGSADET